MSLIVEVFVGSHVNDQNRRMVGRAFVHNVSDLADVSDYEGEISEMGATHLGILPSTDGIKIEQYNRRQSVWTLVRQMISPQNWVIR